MFDCFQPISLQKNHHQLLCHTKAIDCLEIALDYTRKIKYDFADFFRKKMGYLTGSNLLELKAIINDVIIFTTAQSGLSFNFIICNLWVVFNKVRYLIESDFPVIGRPTRGSSSKCCLLSLKFLINLATVS
jgi:hypothetical protein